MADLCFDQVEGGLLVYLPSVPHGPYYVSFEEIDRARSNKPWPAPEHVVARNIAIGKRCGAYQPVEG